MILRIILEFIGVPVALEGSGNLVDGFRKIFLCDLHIPLQATGNSGIGEVGRTDISCGKASIAVEHIGFGVEAGTFSIVANLDFSVRQLTQFFDGFYIGSAHIGRSNDPKLSAILRKLAELVHQQAQTAPLDEGHQHINAVSGNDLFL